MKYILVILTLMLYACDNSRSSYSEIRLEKNSDSLIYLNDIADLCEVVPLETVRAALLSNVSKIQIADSCYYVFDNGHEPAIMRFNLNGKYLGRVGCVGHGKMEYEDIEDFAVSAPNKTVAVLTCDNVVKMYDLDGKYVGTKHLGDSKSYCFTKITSVSDGYALLSLYRGNENDHLVYIFDRDFNLMSSRLKQFSQSIYCGNFVRNPICGVGNKICYFDFYRQTINIMPYDNTEDCQVVQLCTDRMVNMDDFISNAFFENCVDYDFVNDIFFVDNWAFLTVVLESKPYFAQINLDDMSVSINEQGCVPEFKCYHDGYVYSVLSSNCLLEFCKREYPDCLDNWIKAKVTSFIDGYSELDNFVILKMKMKR